MLFFFVVVFIYMDERFWREVGYKWVWKEDENLTSLRLGFAPNLHTLSCCWFKNDYVWCSPILCQWLQVDMPKFIAFCTVKKFHLQFSRKGTVLLILWRLVQKSDLELLVLCMTEEVLEPTYCHLTVTFRVQWSRSCLTPLRHTLAESIALPLMRVTFSPQSEDN